MENKKAWAILKPIMKNEENIKIFEKKITFGRSEGKFLMLFFNIIFKIIEVECNISFKDNKMLSSKHGYIEMNDDDKIWLVDTSRNGIMVNKKKKLTNQVFFKNVSELIKSRFHLFRNMSW